MGFQPPHERRAAVIGAGLAGLQSARALLARGGIGSVVIFEREAEVGGVWRSNYFGYGAQVTRTQYHLPELDPSTLDWYPDGRQLAKHAEYFTDVCHLRDSLRLGTEVIGVRKLKNGRWRVSHRPHMAVLAEAEAREDDFDVVVVAVGLFSQPRVPSLPGAFEGLSIHSHELVSQDLLRGLRVGVVGMGKSACDVTAVAAKVAHSVVVVARSPTWLLPRWFMGLPFRFFASTRFFASLVLADRTSETMQRLQHCVWNWIIEPLARWHFRRVPPALRPSDGALHTQLCHCRSLAIVDAPALQATLCAPHVQCLRGQPIRLESNGLVVSHTEPVRPDTFLELDAIIWATGYDSKGAFENLFDGDTRALLCGEEGELRLYKHMVPVSSGLEGLAFIGRVLSASDVTVSFVQAEWFASVCCNEVRLPTTAERAAEADFHHASCRHFGSSASAHLQVALPLIHTYLDGLVAELQAARRKCGSVSEVSWWRSIIRFPFDLFRYLRPLRSADYASDLL